MIWITVRYLAYKCTHITCIIDVDMTELASNAFYPVSFSQVKLPMAEITVTGVNQVSATSASVSEPSVCYNTTLPCRWCRLHWRVLLWQYL